MKQSHEKSVEAFYSHGSEIRGLQDGGYLSFGLWSEETATYHQAVEALIQYVLQGESALHRGSVLNVACGFGAETVKIYEKICPNRIIAIDLTDSHIEFAKQHAYALNLSDRIVFQTMDACKIDFPPNTFDYVIGIEGPAHFNTRELFLRKAFDALKKDGVLLLTDVIVDNIVVQKNLYNRLIGWFCAKQWYMPKANWMSIGELKSLLIQIGFRVEKSESLGSQVYPGFSHFNLKWASIKNAVQTHGIRIGISLTIISWLLGYVHRRKIADYVFLRAVKPN
jgi:SAM-dependent methyltransferase